MRTITIKLPETLEVDNIQLLMLLASRLYEEGKLSLGQAAEVAGLSKRTFTEMLGKYNVSIFNFPVSDLKKDIANA
jgi:predicted HTH domain antitoxin